MSGGSARIAPPLVLPLLPGVAGERHRLAAVRVAEPQELLQLTQLRVRQRVHRVDDDRLHPGPAPPAVRRALPQHRVHDRHDVRQRLARPGPRGQHVRPARPGHLDRLTLVPVQRQRRRPRIVPGPSSPGRSAHTPGRSSPSRTSSETAPPVAKLGFRLSHGSGHCTPSACSRSTCSRTRGSRTCDKPRRERPVVLDQLLVDPEHIHPAGRAPLGLVTMCPQ